MRRLSDYFRALVWQSGLGYIALWCVAIWTLDEGPAVFGRSGVCQPDTAKVLFYWVCDAASSLSILASASNAALTATVWAPVYIAAATVRPDAILIAAPIVAAHAFGLPAAIFVTMRLMLTLFQIPRGIFSRKKPDAVTPAPTPERKLPDAAKPSRLRYRTNVKPRANFGLRGTPRA
jgi:hypothetical protein